MTSRKRKGMVPGPAQDGSWAPGGSPTFGAVSKLLFSQHETPVGKESPVLQRFCRLDGVSVGVVTMVPIGAAAVTGSTGALKQRLH